MLQKLNERYSLTNRFFKFNYDLPNEVPVLKINNPALSAANPAAYLQQRLNYFAQKLGFPSSDDATDYGDRITLEYKSRVLQIYKGSDAIWYYDRDLTASANPLFAQNLLSENEAYTEAAARLQQLGLDDQDAKFQGVGITTAVIRTSPGGPAQTLKTEVKAQYAFQLKTLPVFGPGAKIKVGFANGKNLSDLVYFWRNPVDPAVTTSSPIVTKPLRSLWWLQIKLAWCKGLFRQAFLHFSKVRMNPPELGYYAAPPYVAQQYYFPVYKISGTIKIKSMDAFPFTYFVLAARMTALERKDLVLARLTDVEVL